MRALNEGSFESPCGSIIALSFSRDLPHLEPGAPETPDRFLGAAKIPHDFASLRKWCKIVQNEA